MYTSHARYYTPSRMLDWVWWPLEIYHSLTSCLKRTLVKRKSTSIWEKDCLFTVCKSQKWNAINLSFTSLKSLISHVFLSLDSVEIPSPQNDFSRSSLSSTGSFSFSFLNPSCLQTLNWLQTPNNTFSPTLSKYISLSYIYIYIYIYIYSKHLWYNHYHSSKLTQWSEFKSCVIIMEQLSL